MIFIIILMLIVNYEKGFCRWGINIELFNFLLKHSLLHYITKILMAFKLVHTVDYFQSSLIYHT